MNPEMSNLASISIHMVPHLSTSCNHFLQLISMINLWTSAVVWVGGVVREAARLVREDAWDEADLLYIRCGIVDGAVDPSCLGTFIALHDLVCFVPGFPLVLFPL